VTAADRVVDVQGPYLRGEAATPFPAQWGFYGDTRRFVFGFCGVRAGKTEGAAEKVVARIAAEMFDELARLSAAGPPDSKGYFPGEWRPSKGTPSDGDEPRRLYWIVAPTYKLAQVAWRKVRRVLARLGPLIVSSKDGVEWLRTGIRVEMRTGKHPDQLQADRVDGALADEICTMQEDAYSQLLNRLTDSGGWLVGIGSPRPGSWAKRRIWDYLQGQERGTAGTDDAGVHHWTTLDNPHIAREHIEAARRDLPAIWFRRDFEAGWATFEGLIYNDYAGALDSATVDVDLSDLRGRQIDVAIDFGLTRPSCVLIAEFDGIAPDGGWGDVIVDEIALTEVKLATVLDRLVARCRELGVAGVQPYCDPAGRARNTQTKRPDMDLVREVLDRAGLLRGRPQYPRTNAERDVLNGIASVQSGFLSADGTRRLFVARRLTEPDLLASYPPGFTGIHRSLLGYSWVKGKTDVPDKDGVHDHDCLAEGEPVLLRRGWTAIEDVRLGDFAWSVDLATGQWDWREVVGHELTHKAAEVVRLTHSRGSVVCTPRHRVMTESGWTHVRDLVPGRAVICYGHASNHGPGGHLANLPGVPGPSLVPVRELLQDRRQGATPGGVGCGERQDPARTSVARPPHQPRPARQPASEPRTALGAGTPERAAPRDRRAAAGDAAARAGERHGAHEGVAPLEGRQEVAQGARRGGVGEAGAAGCGLRRVLDGLRDAGRRGSEVLRRGVQGEGDPSSTPRGGADHAEPPDVDRDRAEEGGADLREVRGAVHGAGQQDADDVLEEVCIVVEVAPLEDRADVYNLTVDGAYNYVGAGGLLSKNCDGLRYWRVKRRGLVSQPPEVELAPVNEATDFGKHIDFGPAHVEAGGGWD